MILKSIKFNIFSNLKRILNLIPKNKKKKFYLLLLFMIFVAGFETITLGVIAIFASGISNPEEILNTQFILIMRNFFNFGFLYNSREFIVFLSIITALMVALKNISLGIMIYAKTKYSMWLNAYIGEILLNGFLSMHYLYYLNKNPSDLVIAVQWRRHFGFLFLALLQLISDSILVLFMLIALFIVNPLITLIVTVILSLVGMFLFTRIKRKIDSNALKIRELESSAHRHASKAINGYKDVRIYGREGFFIRSFNDDVYKQVNAQAFQHFFQQMPIWILETLAFILITCSVFFMYFIIDSTSLEVTSTLVLLAVAAWRILPSVNRILGQITTIRARLPFVDQLFSYLDENRRHRDIQNEKIKAIKYRDKIKIKDLYFSYNNDREEENILSGINFEITKGMNIGIIGTSGAGKSTIADILIGLLLPNEGSIFIDNIRLDDKTKNGWIKSVGYVSQEPYIYDGSIAENIAFGLYKDEIDRNRVIKCCEKASLTSFIESLNFNIDAEVGERGVRISGGQKQRIAIARALYHDPELIIFDEATSALDVKTEKEIQSTIDNLGSSITKIIISHRLSAVSNCNRVIWLENGLIKKIGEPQIVLKEFKSN